MSKAELVAAVQKSLGKETSSAQADRTVDVVINGIKTGVKKTKSVQLIGLGLSKLPHGKHAGASIQRQAQRSKSRLARRSNSCREQPLRKSCNRLIQKRIGEDSPLGAGERRGSR